MNTLKFLSFAAILFFFGCSSKDDNANVVNGVDRTANLQATGASANDFLSASKYNTLVIQVFYVENFRPNAQTLVNLKNFMEARMNKPGGITITETQIASPGNAPYDINEVAQIESNVRTQYNVGNILTMSMLFLDGGTPSDTSNSFILGQAYRNTSFVMYEKTIQDMSNAINEPNRVDLETTVILHELGHLFGLVNLGSPMQITHEDTAHEKHCDNNNCLMYWAVNSSSHIVEMMLGGNIPQLDAHCIADLQANGGK